VMLIQEERLELRNGPGTVYNFTISIFASGLYRVINLIVGFSQEKPRFATLACTE
jgi:hypothetical protein